MIQESDHGNGRGSRPYFACAGVGRSDWVERQSCLADHNAVDRLRCLLSDLGSIKLYRSLARHRHHAVESIYRFGDGLADNQRAPLRPAGDGHGTVVERYATNWGYFSSAGILGIARGYRRLYGSG